MEIKLIVDLPVLWDLERVDYDFLEHMPNNFPSCSEKPQKCFLLKYFNYYRFYGESESRLRQIFAEASLRYVLFDNFIRARLFAVLVLVLMFFKGKHLQESLNCNFFLQWFLKGNKFVYIELS